VAAIADAAGRPLLAAARFGSKFSFQPEAGHIPPGSTATIRVRLASDALGAFEEAFRWHLRGTDAVLSLVIRGRVIGPTFELDTRHLDFGITAFGFRWAGRGGAAPAAPAAAALRLCGRGYRGVWLPGTLPPALPARTRPTRYTKEVLLTNTSKIPLAFNWRLLEGADGSSGGGGGGGGAAAAGTGGGGGAPSQGAAKEFAVLPARGTVLPGGTQRIEIEFLPQARGWQRSGLEGAPCKSRGCACACEAASSNLAPRRTPSPPPPQSVQRYALAAVMDQPGIAEAAAAVDIAAECAVPVLAMQPPGGLLDFGTTFLGFPYRAAFTLVNESRLPAKFEVLPQVD
jgi:hydrocephalus-inducing protein